MNNALSKLLKAPKIKELRGEIKIDRLDVTFTHGTFTSKQYNNYTSQCMTKKIKVDAKGVDADILDIDKLRKIVILNHIIEPNLRDADFLNEGGYTTPSEMLDNIFTPEEILDLYNSIRDLGKTDEDINESAEDLKN